ncbi:IS3 family transposase [Flavobacterium frigoris]|nr:IS3 family transposase [Flavobacterium frigoris]
MSKQAYYKRMNKQKTQDLQAEKIKELITPIRQKMARYGAKKLYLDIQDDFQQNDIKMGRDKFFHFLRNHDLLIKKTKLYHITTDSKHGFYKSKDLLVNLEIKHAEQVFVSDITYIKLASQHAYLALVTDVYSKKIMGYKIDTNMRVQLVKDALQMAVKNRLYNNENLIHHSDRGMQYCCPDFAEFAKSKNIILSTTQNSSPYENAVAERINGILKHEFGLNKTIPNLKTAQKMVKQAIEIYNNERRHCSLEMKTPHFAHLNQIHKYKSYKKKKKTTLEV